MSAAADYREEAEEMLGCPEVWLDPAFDEAIAGVSAHAPGREILSVYDVNAVDSLIKSLPLREIKANQKQLDAVVFYIPFTDTFNMKTHRKEFEGKLLTADDLDEALIGVTSMVDPIAVYDYEKVVMARIESYGPQEDSDEDIYDSAVEDIEFNTVGAWVGDKTPIFVHLR